MMRSIPLDSNPAQFAAFEERVEAHLEARYAEEHEDPAEAAFLDYEAGLEASE